MRIFFIRHAEPNYALNVLTPLGRLQADAMADTMASRGIDALYSSPYGRALETAEPLAARLGLPVKTLDFMREIKWQSPAFSPEENRNLSPWKRTRALAREGVNLVTYDYSDFHGFGDNPGLQAECARVVEGFDAFLSTLGYEREGEGYRVTNRNDATIAIVSHGGSSSIAMAHLMGLHPMAFCGLVHLDFSSICEFSFGGETGEPCSLLTLLLNEHAHLAGIQAPIVFES